MLPPTIYPWQKAPALRLLVPFVAGVLLQWHTGLSPVVAWTALLFFLSCIVILSFQKLPLQFKTAPLRGISLTGLVIATALLVVHENDVRENKNWFGNTAAATEGLLVTLQEPLVEKPATFKALATVEKYRCNDSVFPASGKVVLYFKKDAIAGLGYGTQLWVFKKVSSIKNSGNPAGFDYRRYSLFAGITHQAFLTKTDFFVLPAAKINRLTAVLFTLRTQILSLLKTHIRGMREAGLAEALLIGYKDDLDKNLVQSYSNTGVVHIIAISGLHVGLIYGLLLLLTKPLQGRRLRWLRFMIVLAALWGFGFLAGAQPSVLRSVVMFSAIAAGVVLDRNTSVYNNLALSALLLLCYNPFWLWDVGFQLSYTAVLSIVIFFKPVYNWFYLENKALDALWKLMAVTLAAQVLTTPVSLYYFHQFPLLFLFTNVLAVPLSSAILIGEILLCVFCFIPPVASAIGWVTTLAIRLMNAYIQHLEGFSFSVWQGISISAIQALFLLLFIAGLSYWLLEKKRTGLWLSLTCLFFFMTIRTFSVIHAAQQQQLVVYNIAKHQAIDLFSGQQGWFIGDAALQQNDPAVRLHLQPSRTAYRINRTTPFYAKAFTFCNKKILMLDTTVSFQTFSKPHVDLLILSKNLNINIKEVLTHLAVAQIVIDASVPAWKAAQWQQACNAQHIPCYNVAQKGAFEMRVPHPTFAAL